MRALLLVLVLTVPAWGRDSGQYADAQYKSWYHDQHNEQGQWCCDESDGHPYYGDYSFNPDGSVTVELDGKPHKLEKYMVLNGNNPTGHAVWWFLETYAGHTNYCFAPGTMG